MRDPQETLFVIFVIYLVSFSRKLIFVLYFFCTLFFNRICDHRMYCSHQI
jgi:hypothetical protein